MSTNQINVFGPVRIMWHCNDTIWLCQIGFRARCCYTELMKDLLPIKGSFQSNKKTILLNLVIIRKHNYEYYSLFLPNEPPQILHTGPLIVSVLAVFATCSAKTENPIEIPKAPCSLPNYPLSTTFKWILIQICAHCITFPILAMTLSFFLSLPRCHQTGSSFHRTPTVLHMGFWAN